MGRNSVSFTESSARSSFTPSRPAPYSSFASFRETASSSPSNSPFRLAPGAEVVLRTPGGPTSPYAPTRSWLDVPAFVAPQEVLEGAEIDERRAHRNPGRVAARVCASVLPSLEVHVRFEVRLPRVLHGGFEGDDEHASCAELPCKLIGGKCLPKRILAFHKSAVRRACLPSRWNGSRHGSSRRLRLLRAHGEGLVTGSGKRPADTQFGERCLYVVDRTAHPFAGGVLEALFRQLRRGRRDR